MPYQKCPACGVVVPFRDGDTPGYLRFQCPTHGAFELDADIANSLIQENGDKRMKKLSDRLFTKRQEASPDTLIIVIDITRMTFIE